MITGGWEPISLSSINRHVLYTSTGHGPVPLSISSATHRIELIICFTIMDQLPTISPPQRAKFRRKSVPPRPKTVAARPRRPPPRLSARRRVCCSHPPRRLPTTSPTQQAKLRRGSVSARTNTVAARPPPPAQPRGLSGCPPPGVRAVAGGAATRTREAHR